MDSVVMLAESIFSVIKGKHTESLTKGKNLKLTEAKEQYGFRQMWTIDGQILFKEHDSLNTKPKIYYE